MRLVFLGSGAFGLPTFERLLASHDVPLVVSQPDRPAGRNRSLTPTPIAARAAEAGLETIKPENVNAPEIVERIRSANAEAFVVIAFGQKIGRALRDGMFAINLHASLLPKHRGAAPINWAMIRGDRETGLSVITLADRMDAGDVLAQSATPIDPRETAGELHDRLALMGPELIEQVLNEFRQGCPDFQPQDESLATAAPKFSKTDRLVSFDGSALEARQAIHGVTPWPGCTMKLDGSPIRLARVEVAEPRAPHDRPGLVLEDRTIACGRGSIRLLEVQPPGGKLMSFDAYALGHAARPGMTLEPA